MLHVNAQEVARTSDASSAHIDEPLEECEVEEISTYTRPNGKSNRDRQQISSSAAGFEPRAKHAGDPLVPEPLTAPRTRVRTIELTSIA